MASDTITKEELKAAESLIEFIDSCPSMFHTAMTLSERLEQAGYIYLPEGSAWHIERGGSYYTRRNNSSVIAWHVGKQVAEADAKEQHAAAAPYHFQLTASHADSPTFKVKSVGELEGPQGYLRLNVEAYGGMIDYTWFDRPLSLAGRVLVRTGARVESRLFSLDRDVAIIPSLAIHMNREVNSGFAPNRAATCVLSSLPERSLRARSTRWSPTSWAWTLPTFWLVTCSW